MKLPLFIGFVAAVWIFAFVNLVSCVFHGDSSEYSVRECNQHCPRDGSRCSACCGDQGYKAEFSSCRSRRCLCRAKSLYEAETYEGFEAYGGNTAELNTKPKTNSHLNFYSILNKDYPIPSYGGGGEVVHFSNPTTRSPTYSNTHYRPALTSILENIQTDYNNVGGETCGGFCPRLEYNCSKCCRDIGYSVSKSKCQGNQCVCQ